MGWIYPISKALCRHHPATCRRHSLAQDTPKDAFWIQRLFLHHWRLNYLHLPINFIQILFVKTNYQFLVQFQALSNLFFKIKAFTTWNSDVCTAVANKHLDHQVKRDRLSKDSRRSSNGSLSITPHLSTSEALKRKTTSNKCNRIVNEWWTFKTSITWFGKHVTPFKVSSSFVRVNPLRAWSVKSPSS